MIEPTCTECGGPLERGLELVARLCNRCAQPERVKAFSGCHCESHTDQHGRVTQRPRMPV